MSEQVWWYLTRASGIVAWLMLTASVIWGIVLSTKAFPEQRRPAWLLDLHRWLGGWRCHSRQYTSALSSPTATCTSDSPI